MIRRLLWLTIAFVVSLLLVSALLVSAGTFRSPARDNACYLTFGQCADNFGVQVEAQLPPGGGACEPSVIGYIGWDLTGETKIWKSAALTLTAYSVGTGTPPYTFALYPVISETWAEADNASAGPGYEAAVALATATDDLSDNQVVFRDDASNKLGIYFLGKKGGSASVAVVMTGGCGAATTIAFEDLEGTGGSMRSSLASANEPNLVFYTGDAANAVTLSTFRSADPAASWPLIAAAGALALLAAGIVYRRLTA